MWETHRGNSMTDFSDTLDEKWSEKVAGGNSGGKSRYIRVARIFRCFPI
jgi:hypothetical protein